MSVAAPSTPPEAGGVAADMQTWRRAAALSLGAPESVARRFGETGVAEFHGKPVSLQPLQADPSGPWLAVTRAQRPAGLGEAPWCDALLLATSRCVAATHAAFALADDGDGVVLLRIPAGHDHPDLLAAELYGLFGLRQAVEAALKSDAPAVAPVHASPAPAGGRALADADIQEFEAPQDMLERVHAAAVALGFGPEQALAAVRSGRLEVDGIPVGLACDDIDQTLVVAAEVAPQALDTPARRRLALQANVELMAMAGVALALDRGQARLVSRCRNDGRSGADLAAWLRSLAGLSRAIAEQRGAEAIGAH